MNPSLTVDARWSNYARYLKQMTDAIQMEWEQLLTRNRSYPDPGTSVTVKFTLNREGEIARIALVTGDAGDEAMRACVSAITNRAPYGKWTDDMVKVLGEGQQMTFRFYYR